MTCVVPFDYNYFGECPVWWKNFVNYNDLHLNNDRPDIALDKKIALYNGKIIDGERSGDVKELIFETDDDFEAFKIFWTIYGK